MSDYGQLDKAALDRWITRGDDDWTDEDHGPGCDGPLNCTCSQTEPVDTGPSCRPTVERDCVGCRGTGVMPVRGGSPCLCLAYCNEHDSYECAEEWWLAGEALRGLYRLAGA